jgi:hypothetical protein
MSRACGWPLLCFTEVLTQEIKMKSEKHDHTTNVRGIVQEAAAVAAKVIEQAGERVEQAGEAVGEAALNVGVRIEDAGKKMKAAGKKLGEPTPSR